MPTETTEFLTTDELALRIEKIETKDAIGRKIIQVIRTSSFIKTNVIFEYKASYLILYERKS